MFLGLNDTGVQDAKISPALVGIIGGNGEKENVSPQLNEKPFQMFQSPETQIEESATGRDVEETETEPNTSGKKKLTLMLARPLRYFQMGKYMPHIDAGNPALVVPSAADDGTFDAVDVFAASAGHYDKSLLPIYNKDGKKIANVHFRDDLLRFKADQHRKRQNIPHRIKGNKKLDETGVMSSVSTQLTFDVSSGDEIIDSSDNKNNGTLWGAATLMPTNYSCGMACRLLGGAVRLNGSEFKNKPSKAVTVAVWLKVNSTSGKQSIFATDDLAVGGHYHFELVNGRITWVYMGTRGLVFDCKTETEVVQNNKWVHVAGTYDSTESK